MESAAGRYLSAGLHMQFGKRRALNSERDPGRLQADPLVRHDDPRCNPCHNGMPLLPFGPICQDNTQCLANNFFCCVQDHKI